MLDTHGFGPGKKEIRRLIRWDKVERGILSVSKWQLPSLIHTALENVLTRALCMAGFADTGAWPLNTLWADQHPHLFSYSTVFVKEQLQGAKTAIDTTVAAVAVPVAVEIETSPGGKWETEFDILNGKAKQSKELVSVCAAKSVSAQ